METKICSKCGRELPKTEFYRRSSSPDGLQPYCKECSRKYGQIYYNQTNMSQEGGGKTAPFSDPDFDDKQPVEVIQLMARAKKWLESRGYSITLKGEYREVKIRQVKFL